MGTVFETLGKIDLAEYIEKKDGLSYVSWANAWAEVKKRIPEASYTIWKNESGLPYVYDPLTGFMVYTSVTIDGITHEMWLPVMDGKNKAMKADPYTYKVKEYRNNKWTGNWIDRTVEPATMFDINKTIMRCLVKNLAMFGLGLYIYAGEDLPNSDDEEKKEGQIKGHIAKKKTPSARDLMLGYINRHQMSEESIAKLCECYKIGSLDEVTDQIANHYIEAMGKKGININE